MRDIREYKKQLRIKYKSIRSEMSAQHKVAADEKITARLLNLWVYRECECVVCYVSTPIEVSTHAIIDDALRRGKRVAVPKCTDKSGHMKFYYITGAHDLTPGAYGVLEPEINPDNELRSYENAICIVPALSFCAQGYRLGFGKGYYDRFLSRFSGEKIGLCYDECMSESLKTGRYDVKVDKIVTQSKLFNIV